MVNVAAPKTRVLSGPGILYRAAPGILAPGQVSLTVTTKALASNVVTLTVGTHSVTVGQKILVAINDPVFDGYYTVSAVAGTTISYARVNANVTSGAATGTVKTQPGGTVAGGKFTDAWPAGWVPIGVTKEGHEWEYSVSTGGIEVAEYLLPIIQVAEGAEGKVSFTIVQYTAQNLGFALAGGAVSTVSGTGDTLLTSVTPPNPSDIVRTQLGWESDDGTERGLFYQLLAAGGMKVSHRKGADPAALEVELMMEQPAYGPAFERLFAGATPVGL